MRTIKEVLRLRWEAGVHTRPRTARHVPLCAAFGPRPRLCLGCLGFAPLSARLCA